MTPSAEQRLPVSLIPEQFRHAFPFEKFNIIQSGSFNLLYRTEKSVIVATPTGSGKTVIAEIAFIHSLTNKKGKLMYLSPLKALSYEKENEFLKFKKNGVKTEVFTGDAYTYDNQIPQKKRLIEAQLIIATIEKIDSLTRRKDFKFLIRELSLLIVDEIHLIGDESRGSNLEALLTRIRILNPNCRIIGLSATIPNCNSIAQWLSAEAIVYGDEFRPSKLIKKIIAYESTGNEFKDKYRRIYKSWLIIRKFCVREHKEFTHTLVFVSSRGDTVLTAKKLVDYIVKEKLNSGKFENQPIVHNPRLRELLPYGVAFHHAGLQFEDRKTVENNFREGKIKILVATSTLAWGVNLPAKVVIIQNVIIRTLQGNIFLSSADLWQMLGRAGRPQYDKQGYGYIITSTGEIKEKINYRLNNPEPVISQIAPSQIIAQILLAELYRSSATFENLEQHAKHTFYWTENIQSPLIQEEFLQKYENTLVNLERWNLIINYDEIYRVTPVGAFIAQYYLDIESGRLLIDYARKKVEKGIPLLQAIIQNIVPFQKLSLRSSERKVVQKLAREFLSWKEDPKPHTKVLVILYRLLQNERLPTELIGDGYIIKSTFLRYWAFFKEIYRFFHGETNLFNQDNIWDEIFWDSSS
ncbi:MAG: DEAD/DEAH box helicase [Candidatus Hodarchaeales archaeon]|jgi:replicative superfamily II helicase